MNKPPILCDKCDSNFSCLLDYDGENCRKTRSVEPTNADDIRAMTNEELAKFLLTVWEDGEQINQQYPFNESNWLDWLKQEVNDEIPL